MNLTNQILFLVFLMLFLGSAMVSIVGTMVLFSSGVEGFSLFVTISAFVTTGVFGYLMYYYSKKMFKPF